MRKFDFRQSCLPYLMRKKINGEFIFLNREYKPIGFDVNICVNYEDYPISKCFNITKKQLEKLKLLGCKIQTYENRDYEYDVFFYDDASNILLKENRKKYFDIISYLIDLKG